MKTPIGKAMKNTLSQMNFLNKDLKKIFEDKFESVIEQRFEQIKTPYGVETVKNEDK